MIDEPTDPPSSGLDDEPSPRRRPARRRAGVALAVGVTLAAATGLAALAGSSGQAQPDGAACRVGTSIAGLADPYLNDFHPEAAPADFEPPRGDGRRVEGTGAVGATRPMTGFDVIGLYGAGETRLTLTAGQTVSGCMPDGPAFDRWVLEAPAADGRLRVRLSARDGETGTVLVDANALTLADGTVLPRLIDPNTSHRSQAARGAL